MTGPKRKGKRSIVRQLKRQVTFSRRTSLHSRNIREEGLSDAQQQSKKNRGYRIDKEHDYVVPSAIEWPFKGPGREAFRAFCRFSALAER